jgi:hypothetical protein
LGWERPQFPALPAQQLSACQRRCRMRRYFESLCPSDRSAIDGLFLVGVVLRTGSWSRSAHTRL